MSGPDPPRFRFLTDENVSSRVADLISGFGHDVFESRLVVFPGAADRVVAAAAHLEGLIIVSHDRDFRESIKRVIPSVSKRGLRRLPLLQLGMTGPRSVGRVRQCWPLVQHHLTYARESDLEIARIVLLEQEVEVRYRIDREEDPIISGSVLLPQDRA